MRSFHRIALAAAALSLPAFGASADPFFAYYDLKYTNSQIKGITNSGWVWGNAPGPQPNTGFTFIRRDAESISNTRTGWVSEDGFGGLYILGIGIRRNTLSGESTAIPQITVFNEVNRAGQVVGATGDLLLYADLGTGWATHQIYHPPTAIDGRPLFLSDSGYIAGTIYAPTDGNRQHAFVWKDGVFKDLGRGNAFDVNDNGQVLIGNSGLPKTAWIYDARTSATTMISQPNEEGNDYVVTGINRWGQVSGAYLNNLVFDPFVWQDGRVIRISPLMTGAEFTLQVPTTINDRGQIAGYGKYPNAGTSTESVILTPRSGTSSFYPESSQADGNSLSALFANAATERWYALTSAAPLATVTALDSPGASAADSASLRPKALKYVAKGVTRFTGIRDFPLGFAQPVSVSVDGIILGTFSPGQPLHFADYAAMLGSHLVDGGVNSFDITGIADLAGTNAADRADFAVNLLLSQATGDFSIHARNSVLGDLDGDGHVSIEDFNIFKQNWGLDRLSWYNGDFDVSGKLSAADFYTLTSRFDVMPTAYEMSEVNLFETRVPEPSSLAAVGLAAIAALRRPIRVTHRR